MPPPEAQLLPSTRKIGVARLKVLGFQIYDARLWATPGFSVDDLDNSTFALEITYLRNFDNNAIADRSIKEMRHIGAMLPVQESQWLEQMRVMFPDIKKGDRLTGVHKPGTGAAFSLNGSPIGEIRDPEFARLFFGIWLNNKTSHPQMRRDLLREVLADRR